MVHEHVAVAVVAPAHLEAVAIGLGAWIAAVLEPAVAPGPAVLEDGGNIGGAAHIAVPAVVAVAPGTAAIKIVIAADVEFRGKAVGVAIVGRVGIMVRVAVDDAVVVGAGGKLDAGVAALEEGAIFNQVVRACDAGDLQAVVAGALEIEIPEMPPARLEGKGPAAEGLFRAVDQRTFARIAPQAGSFDFRAALGVADGDIGGQLMDAGAEKDGVAPRGLDDRLGDGLEGLVHRARIEIAAVRGDINGGTGEGGEEKKCEKNLFHFAALSWKVNGSGQMDRYY
ncbi:MAG: hypothetical protein BWY77_01811 [bacterium ADurb.Bin431]|nr:MAG: hypothetical protein BWY77_01811 [bacterium ADurb.Bin431]